MKHVAFDVALPPSLRLCTMAVHLVIITAHVTHPEKHFPCPILQTDTAMICQPSTLQVCSLNSWQCRRDKQAVWEADVALARLKQVVGNTPWVQK